MWPENSGMGETYFYGVFFIYVFLVCTKSKCSIFFFHDFKLWYHILAVCSWPKILKLFTWFLSKLVSFFLSFFLKTLLLLLFYHSAIDYNARWEMQIQVYVFFYMINLLKAVTLSITPYPDTVCSTQQAQNNQWISEQKKISRTS